MADFCVTLRLALPPDRANTRRHWSAQRRLEQQWALRATVDLANTQRRPTVPLRRFTAHVLVYTSRRSDLDNCTARLKKVWDTLKRLKWIEDDSSAHMTSLTVANGVDAKNPRIEVHICEAQ